MTTKSIQSAQLIELNLPDPSPLLAALAALDEHAAALGSLTEEKAKLEKRIEAFFKSEEAQDPDSFGDVAGYRVRVEAIPGIIEKVKARRYTLADSLVSEVEEFEQALSVQGMLELNATLDSIEADIRHRVPGRHLVNGVEVSNAHQIAWHFPEIKSIPHHPSHFVAPKLSKRPNPSSWGNSDGERESALDRTVETARARAKALLTIRDRAEATRRFGKNLDQIAKEEDEKFAAERKAHAENEEARRKHELEAQKEEEAGKERAERTLREMRSGLNEAQKETLETMRKSGAQVE